MTYLCSCPACGREWNDPHRGPREEINPRCPDCGTLARRERGPQATFDRLDGFLITRGLQGSEISSHSTFLEALEAAKELGYDVHIHMKIGVGRQDL